MNLAGYVAQVVYHNHARRFKTDRSLNLGPSPLSSLSYSDIMLVWATCSQLYRSGILPVSSFDL